MTVITKSLNKTFTIIFLIEMACKIISMGFLFNSVNNDKAYIRSYWNIIDFIVVMFSGVDLVSTNSTFKSFKILRCFRALRPLKVINKNEQLKIIVNTLFQIVPQLGKVIGLLFMIILLFASLLMQVFKGEFYHCYSANGHIV